MLRNLRKLFGGDEAEAARSVRTGHLSDEPAPSSVPAESSHHDTHCPITSSVLGQALIVTLTDSDLNAFKAAEVNHEIRMLYEAHPEVRHLVLDMENIKFLDSAGLNTLVDLISPIRQRRGCIAVAAACQQVEVLFKLTRLELLFKIRRTTLEAIDAVERAG